MHFSFCRNKKSLFKGKKDRKHNEDEGNEMVPSEGLGLEHGNHDDGEYNQGNGLLNDFQLDKVERASVGWTLPSELLDELPRSEV